MFRKKKMEIRLVKDETPVTNVYNPNSFDGTDVRLTIEELARSVMAAYAFCKITQTLCGVVTHVVVTKVQPSIIVEAVKE